MLLKLHFILSNQVKSFQLSKSVETASGRRQYILLKAGAGSVLGT